MSVGPLLGAGSDPASLFTLPAPTADSAPAASDHESGAFNPADSNSLNVDIQKLRQDYQHGGAPAFTEGLLEQARQLSSSQFAELLKSPLLSGRKGLLLETIQAAMTPGQANAGQVIKNLSAICQAAAQAGAPLESGPIATIVSDFIIGSREVITGGGSHGGSFSTVGGGTAQAALAQSVREGDGVLTGELIQAEAGNTGNIGGRWRPDIEILARTAADQGLGLGVPAANLMLEQSDAPLLHALLPPAQAPVAPPPPLPHAAASAIRQTDLAWQRVQAARTPTAQRDALSALYRALWTELQSSYSQLPANALLKPFYGAWLQRAIKQLQANHPGIPAQTLNESLMTSIVLQEAQVAQGGADGREYAQALGSVQQSLQELPVQLSQPMAAAVQKRVLADPYVGSLVTDRIAALLAAARRAQGAGGGERDLAALRVLGEGLSQADPTGAVNPAILASPYTRKLLGQFVAAASHAPSEQVTLPLVSAAIQALAGSPQLAVMLTRQALPLLEAQIAGASDNSDQGIFYSSLAAITAVVGRDPGGAALIQTLVQSTAERLERDPVLFSALRSPDAQVPTDPAAKEAYLSLTKVGLGPDESAFGFGQLSAQGSDPSFFYQLADALSSAAGTQKEPAFGQWASAMRASLGAQPGATALRAPSAPSSAQDSALQRAQQREQNLLSPLGSLADAPATQYALLQKNPEALAQPWIDQVIAQTGTGPLALHGAQLDNVIGTALGFQPANGATLQQAVQGSGTAQSDWFSGAQLAQIATIRQKLYQLAGGLPQVSIEPVEFATPDDGTQTSALFRVRGSDGVVDPYGMTFSSVKDFQAHNQWAAQGKIVLPSNAQARVGRDGNVELTSIVAHYQTFGQHVQADATTTATVVGLVAAMVGGAAAEIGTAGVATPAVAVDEAAAVAAFGGMAAAGESAVTGGLVLADTTGSAVAATGEVTIASGALSDGAVTAATEGASEESALAGSSEATTNSAGSSVRTARALTALRPAARLAGGLASATFFVGSARTLDEMRQHGQSISLANPEAFAAWGQLASAGLSEGAGGLEQVGLRTAARVTGVGATLTGAAPVGQQIYLAATQNSVAWSTVFEGLAQMALGAVATRAGEEIGRSLAAGAPAEPSLEGPRRVSVPTSTAAEPDAQLPPGIAESHDPIPIEISSSDPTIDPSAASTRLKTAQVGVAGASPEAQEAFTALFDSGGLWTQRATEVMDAYLTWALAQQSPDLQAAAEAARNALDEGRTEGNFGVHVSGPESDALGALLAQDIRVTQTAAIDARQTQPDAVVASTPDPIISESTIPATAEVTSEDLTSQPSRRIRELPSAVRAAGQTLGQTLAATLIAQLDPLSAGNMLMEGGDLVRYFGRQFRNTEDRATIPQVRRQLAIMNGSEPPMAPTPAQEAYALGQFPADTLSTYDAGVQARIASLVLAFHGEARDNLTNLVSRLAGREPSGQAGTLSPKQQRERDRDINAVIELAAQQEVPEPLLRLVDPPPASSPLGAILNMALGGAQEFAAKSSYGESAAHFAELFNEVTNSPTRELRLLFETGAVGLGPEGQLGPSIHAGIVGTAKTIRFLGAVAKELNIVFKPTIVTEYLNVPVVKAVNEALGVDDTEILTAPHGSWGKKRLAQLMNEHNPNAVLSIGQSAANGGAKSLIVPAGKLGIPTFAIGDNTDDGSRFRLDNAQHAMAASMVDIGAEAFIKGVADHLDFLGLGQRRSPILRRSTKFGFAKFISGLDLVDKAYQAAEAKGAIFDDGRFGASPGTFSIATLLGAENLVDQALIGAKSIDGPARAPTWLDLVTARAPGALSQRNGSAQARLETYNKLFQRAQPAETFWGQLAALPFNFSQYRPRDKALQAVTAGYMVGGTGFILSTIGTRDPAILDAVAALAAFNAVRQGGIFIVAGTERLAGALREGPTPTEPPDLRPVRHLPIAWLDKRIQRFVATDPAAVAKNNRLRYLFNMSGRTTYPPSMAADWAQAVSAQLSLHGAALHVAQGAFWFNFLGLGMVSILYFRNLPALRVGLDGTPRADSTFKASDSVTLAVDQARIPLAVAAALNIVGLAWLHRPVFNLATSSDVIANYVRNWTSVDKAAGVWGWQRRLNRLGQKVMGPGYEWFDLLASTWPGNLGTIFVSAYSELQELLSKIR